MTAAAQKLSRSVSSRLRRRKAMTLLAFTLLISVLLLSVLNHSGCVAHHGADWRRFDRKDATVTRVVDGDTLRVRIDGSDEQTIVRLIGIDAPELHWRDNAPSEHFARQAADYARSRADGQRVLLRLEPTRSRDRYKRLLAYVWLSDNECLNFALVRDGFAYADRRFNHTYRSLYEQAENDARKKQRGLWKDVTEEQMPAWRRQWLAEIRRER